MWEICGNPFPTNFIKAYIKNSVLMRVFDISCTFVGMWVMWEYKKVFEKIFMYFLKKYLKKISHISTSSLTVGEIIQKPDRIQIIVLSADLPHHCIYGFLYVGSLYIQTDLNTRICTQSYLHIWLSESRMSHFGGLFCIRCRNQPVIIKTSLRAFCEVTEHFQISIV